MDADQAGGAETGGQDDDQMDTVASTELERKTTEEVIRDLIQDPDLAVRLHAEEQVRRLEVRRAEDADDASLALALQLQAQEEELRTRAARRILPPLYQGPGSDDIDIYVCVDRELQPDHGAPTSPAGAWATPAPPPPSSSSSPPLHMGLFPPGADAFKAISPRFFSGGEGDSEDDLPEQDDIRIVSVNRFSTIAQLMQTIVKSDVFPIRKVSYISHISFRAIPEAPEAQQLRIQPATAPVFGSFFTSAPQEQQTPELSVTSFVRLPAQMKLSDLPVTEDSVFKIILRKRDRDRKRKRRSRANDGSMEEEDEDADPPTNSILNKAAEEAIIWKAKYEEAQARWKAEQTRADNLEQDLVLEKLPRLELPDKKKSKSHSDPQAENTFHTVSDTPLPPSAPVGPRPVPKAFALPDFSSSGNPPAPGNPFSK